MTSRTLLVAALLLPLLGACGLGLGGGGKQAPAGTVVRDAYVADGDHLLVWTPAGGVDFTFSGPVDKLPESDNDVYSQAADGVGFIGVSWHAEIGTAAPMLDDASDGPRASYALVLDKHKYPLKDAMAGRDGAAEPSSLGSAWVAVKNPPPALTAGDVAVQVEYDGLTQTVSATESGALQDGPASMLYRSRAVSLGTFDCGEPSSKGWTFDASLTMCRITEMRVPYYRPVGWAPDPEGWLVLGVDAYPSIPVPKGGGYLDLGRTPPPATYTIDGTKPTKVIPPAQASVNPAVEGTVVFPGTATGELTVVGEFAGRTDAGPRTLAVTWRTRLYQ